MHPFANKLKDALHGLSWIWIGKAWLAGGIFLAMTLACEKPTPSAPVTDALTEAVAGKYRFKSAILTNSVTDQEGIPIAGLEKGQNVTEMFNTLIFSTYTKAGACRTAKGGVDPNKAAVWLKADANHSISFVCLADPNSPTGEMNTGTFSMSPDKTLTMTLSNPLITDKERNPTELPLPLVVRNVNLEVSTTEATTLSGNMPSIPVPDFIAKKREPDPDPKSENSKIDYIPVKNFDVDIKFERVQQ